MWKFKKKIWPKNKTSIPTGKFNHQGKLVTSPEDMKILLAKEYSERLRPRPEHPDMKHIFEVKKEVFEAKMKEAMDNKSPDWNMCELEDVLKHIGLNKARDPDGFDRNIFHNNCIGFNLKESVLIMFNNLKKEGKIPTFMKIANISTIPKSGSKYLLKNERGIFVLSAVRTILMRLLYTTRYEIINSHMSDSNVGGRQNINHIFVINGIIQETLSSKNNRRVTLKIYDYKQLFDSMNLEESLSNLFDSGMKDNTLALLYDANSNVRVKVKTSRGFTLEKKFQRIVLQGDTWAPTMAANQVDTFGKQLLEEEPDYLYKYKGKVNIGLLGMIDDLAGVSESGVKAKKLNAFINVKTAEKNLQFGPDKCHTMIISHKKTVHIEPNLFIDH